MRRLFFLFLSLLIASSCGYRAQVAAEESEVLFHQGMKWFYLGEITAAEDCFSRVVARNKNNDAAFYHLSQIAAYQNQWDKADKYLQRALKLEPDNYWYRMQQAKMMMALGDYKKAGMLYEALWKEYPSKTELLYERIGLYMNTNQSGQALRLLDTLEDRSGVTESSILLRFNLLSEEDTEQAAAMLRACSLENPSPRILSVLGDIAAGEGKIDSAGVYYRKTLEMEPTFMPAVFGLAEMYRMKRQFDLYFENINVFLASSEIEPRMKTDYLEQILESRGFVSTFQPQVDTLFMSIRSAHPADSTLAYMYAGYLVRTQRPRQAITTVKDNIDYHPIDYNAWYQALGLIYFLKEWPLLCEYGERALEVFPDNIDFSSLYGLALWQTGRLEDAVERFERILSMLKKEDTNNRVQTLSLLGDLYQEKGNSRQAYKMYDQVLRLDKENLPVLNNYAYYLSLEDNELEKALSMSQITVDKEPNNATYLDTYGWILYKLGNTAEAKTALRQSLAYGGKESAVILEHYGDILHALNEPLMAIVYWQQAYDIEPREDLLQKINANKKATQ